MHFLSHNYSPYVLPLTDKQFSCYYTNNTCSPIFTKRLIQVELLQTGHPNSSYSFENMRKYLDQILSYKGIQNEDLSQVELLKRIEGHLKFFKWYHAFSNICILAFFVYRVSMFSHLSQLLNLFLLSSSLSIHSMLLIPFCHSRLYLLHPRISRSSLFLVLPGEYHSKLFWDSLSSFFARDHTSSTVRSLFSIQFEQS